MSARAYNQWHGHTLSSTQGVGVTRAGGEVQPPSICFLRSESRRSVHWLTECGCMAYGLRQAVEIRGRSDSTEATTRSGLAFRVGCLLRRSPQQQQAAAPQRCISTRVMGITVLKDTPSAFPRTNGEEVEPKQSRFLPPAAESTRSSVRECARMRRIVTCRRRASASFPASSVVLLRRPPVVVLAQAGPRLLHATTCSQRRICGSHPSLREGAPAHDRPRLRAAGAAAASPANQPSAEPMNRLRRACSFS
jgi:hypothetical protein